MDNEHQNIINFDGVVSLGTVCLRHAATDRAPLSMGFDEMKVVGAHIIELKGDRIHSGRAHDSWIVDEQRQGSSSRQRIAYLYKIRRWLLD